MSVKENKTFYLVSDKNYSFPDCAYLRSTIDSEEGAVNFVEKLSEKTDTNWIHRLTNKSSSSKFAFHRTWLCHLSLSKNGRLPTHGVRCSARIVIFMKKSNFTQEDRYLCHKPPLPCVICIRSQHSHCTGKDNGPRLACFTEEVKTKFYDFFESGLTVIKAKTKYDALYKLQKSNHKLKASCTPTIRQTQCLYNHWCSVRKTSTLKEESGRVVTVSLEEFLSALPRIKKPVLTGRTTFFYCPPAVENALFPMNFVSMNSFGIRQNFPNQTYPLLFKLKWTIEGILPPHVLLQVYEVRINCPKCKATNTLSTVEKVESSTPVPEKNLQFPIKEEPMDCDELESVEILSQENLFFEQKSTEIQQNMSAVSVIIDDYLCVNKCIDSKISSQLPSLDRDYIGTKTFRLPLVFTSVCSRDSSLKTSFSTLYTLRHGPSFEYATQDSMNRILSVEINSQEQATLNMQTYSGSCDIEPYSLTKVPLSVSVKIEQRERVLCRSNVVSSPIVALRQPIAIIPGLSSRKDFLNTRSSTTEAILDDKSGKHSCISKDDDYEFLMSLLPTMKKLSQDHKSKVKEKLQNFVTTSQICASIMNFEERSNVYRDCGVLPVLRDLKF